MARDLAVEPARLGAAITSYLVALTVFIPVSGWVADRFGAKRVFMVAIVVFTLASVLCGRATGVPELIAARVLQGVGGAMMVPVARLLLLRQISKDEMLTAMAWLTMPAMIGPISGPPLGGFLTDAFGWQSVFLINLPIGVLGLALVAWKIPAIPPGNPGPPDRIGLFLIGGALALFMFGLETIGRGVVPQGMPQVGLVLGRDVRLGGDPALPAGQAAGARPLAAEDPDLQPIAPWRARCSASAPGPRPSWCRCCCRWGSGNPRPRRACVSFATALGALAMKPLARPLLKRFGFRRALIGASLVAAVGVALPAAFTPAWPLPLIFALLALGGLFRSLQFTALNTLAFADVPTARLSAATSFAGTAQQLAPALGVVLATTSLEVSAMLSGRHVPEVHDFAMAFLVAAVVVAASAPFFARLAPDAGEAVSGHGVKRVAAE